jgi:Rps23 Pro-64 3,4-dihydroxylase Tpa1-like proline 4-hydroxylase
MAVISYHEIQNLPLVVVDEFYDQSSYEKIWDEICFLNNDPRKLKKPENLDSAYTIENSQKIYLKNTRGLILDEIYKDRSVSNILVENRKLFNADLISELLKLHGFFRYFNTSNHDITKLHYYENLDSYDFHIDQSIITAVTYFLNEPKKFSGGELLIENELEIDCIKNRVVIFPSILYHAVKKIEMSEQNTGKNLGRYSITQFIGIK